MMIRVFLLLGLFLNVNLNASGIFLYEVAAQRVGLGSAGWTAQATDPSTLFTNPAGMSHFCEQQVGFGAEPLFLHIKFDPNQETTVSGKKGHVTPFLPSGGVYYVKPLNNRLHLGVGGLGYFGAKLKYNDNWVGRYYVTEVTLQGFSGAFSLSYRVTPDFSLGLGYTPSFGVFRQKAKVNNLLDALPDGNLEVKDNDWGHGFYLGGLYQYAPECRFGIYYLSDVNVKFEDTPKFTGLGPVLKNLLNQTGITQNPVLLDVRCPQLVMVGFYHTLNCHFALMGDLGWQQWSRFGFAQITLGSTSDTTLTIVPNYEDAWHVALGGEWRISPTTLWSLGGAYDSSMMSNKERTFTFPVGKQWRLGTGAKWEIKECTSFQAAYELQWSGDLPVSQDRGPLAGNVSGTFSSTAIHVLNVTIAHTF